MPREIVTDWIGPQGSGMVSVMWFDAGIAVATQRAAVSAFLNAYDANISNTYSWTVRTAGRDLDNATGALVGAWSDATPQTGTGAVGTAPVPDATQVLYQWHTGSIVSGRFLRGRTFLPGLTASSTTGGNISSSVVTGLTGYGTTFLAANVGFQVWHRPQNGAGGSVALGGTCSVWPELAVLRRRRK